MTARPNMITRASLAFGSRLMAFWGITAEGFRTRGQGTERGSSALVGRLLCDKWRIERRLGFGGMSFVFAGTHRNGKRVAIKVLRPELTSNERIRRRFLREGYIANRVGHEGAVSVLDDAVDGGIVFLVMELLEGEALDARCQRLGGKLPLADVLIVTRGLLDVLISAHANGVVHRDVKPSNIFLSAKGQIKLLDFGIASLREVTGPIGQTRTGSMLGTPGFMAPEQARGRWTEVGPHTDIWAVGATMFRLLSGRLVHDRTTPNESMIASATREPPSLATLSAELPASVVELVDRALKLDPADRWQSASEMREAVVMALSSVGSDVAENVLETYVRVPSTVPDSADAWTRESSYTPPKFDSGAWRQRMQKSRLWRLAGVLALSAAIATVMALIASIPAPRELRSGLVDSRKSGVPRSPAGRPRALEIRSFATPAKPHTPAASPPSRAEAPQRRSAPAARGRPAQRAPEARAPVVPESQPVSNAPEQALDLSTLLNNRE